MLLNGRSRIFVGKRIDQTVEGWQMPQGGIDFGAKTAYRGECANLKERPVTEPGGNHREMSWLTTTCRRIWSASLFTANYSRPTPEMVRAALSGRG